MACEICGRSSCSASFHSIDEQSAFYDNEDKYKEIFRNRIIRELNRKLDQYDIDGRVGWLMDDVEKVINDVLW